MNIIKRIAKETVKAPFYAITGAVEAIDEIVNGEPKKPQRVRGCNDPSHIHPPDPPHRKG